MLSRARNEVLMKAVLQAIPTYIMSCFALPKSLVNSIEAAIRAFWWGSGDKRKMAWLSWEQLCKPKNQGGMGFRDLHSFNKVLLGKQCWRILTKPESLMARIFKARYFPHGSFMDATTGSRPSATWSSLLKARGLISRGLRLRIGNGYSTDIWSSPWIPDDNRIVWHHSKNEVYSVKSAYHVARAMKEGEGERETGAASGVAAIKWMDIWNLALQPKIRLFIWRACKNILPHAVELTRKRISSSLFCLHCKTEMETISHVLMECRGLRDLWSSDPFSLPMVNSQDSMWYIFCLLRRSVSEDLFLVGLVIWWKVWDMRNKELHGIEVGFPSDLVKWATEYLACYHSAQVKPPPAFPNPLPNIWVPPDPGTIKVNVDATLPEKTNFIRVSMIARNSHGNCLW